MLIRSVLKRISFPPREQVVLTFQNSFQFTTNHVNPSEIEAKKEKMQDGSSSKIIIEKSDLVENAKDVDFLVINEYHGNPRKIRDFVDSNGEFSIDVFNTSMEKFGHYNRQIIPKFRLYRPLQDISLLHEVQKAFGYGNVNVFQEANMVEYKVLRIGDLQHRLIPFFKKFRLVKKQEEFQRFRIIISLMKKKEYQTREGIEKIEKVRNGEYTLSPELQALFHAESLIKHK
jgi:hypothetical protein